MGTILGLLGLILGLANLDCFIMVLVKLFQDKGVLHGILGLICSLYTFIWGWMNVDKNKNRDVMLGWTACIVLGLVLNVMARAMAS
jgi:hypothetical protein